MPAFSETGHAKNVANFSDLISFCQAYGVTYNPSKANITISALQTMLTNASNTVDIVTNKNTAYNNAVNARVLAFKDIRQLCTRLLNALQTTNASDEMVGNAKSINRKIQGKRATASVTKTTAPDPNKAAPTTISASQLSYDQQIEHFNKLVELLKSEPTYIPNEADLKIATLTTYYTQLKNTNTAVSTAYTSVSNARIARDKALYLPITGLNEIAQDVKKYIKSIFGATSPEYKQVSVINFVTRKI